MRPSRIEKIIKKTIEESEFNSEKNLIDIFIRPQFVHIDCYFDDKSTKKYTNPELLNLDLNAYFSLYAHDTSLDTNGKKAEPIEKFPEITYLSASIQLMSYGPNPDDTQIRDVYLYYHVDQPDLDNKIINLVEEIANNLKIKSIRFSEFEPQYEKFFKRLGYKKIGFDPVGDGEFLETWYAKP